MSTTTRIQRRYDHRLKQLVRTTGNINVALESGVPRSTAYGWLNNSQTNVISLEVHDAELADLQREVVQLRHKNARLLSLLRLIMIVVKLAGFSLVRVRLPEEGDKFRVLRTIEQARVHFPLRTVLRVIGLTHGRFHAWRTDPCVLVQRFYTGIMEAAVSSPSSGQIRFFFGSVTLIYPYQHNVARTA